MGAYPRFVLLRIMLSSFTSRFAATSSFSSLVSRVYSARSLFTPGRISMSATSFLHPLSEQERDMGMCRQGPHTLGVGDNQANLARGERDGYILEGNES